MTEKQYIPLIDYLKAFAILMVTTTHFFTYDDKDFPVFIYVVQMGMPLFMLLIGYNTAMSNERHGIHSLKALYAPARLGKQFGAILPSYTLMFIIEAVACGALLDRMPLGEWMYAYATGGLQGGSHGGYFFAVYWQFLILAPILYLLVKKYPRATLVGALLLNIVYEYAVGAWDIPRWLNRLLFMRYLFIAVFGLSFFLWRKRFRLWLVGAAACLSLWYITALEFFDFHWELSTYWKNTSVYASFYYIAVVVFAFYFFEDKRLPERLHELAHTVGSATWHIYLTQMLYFRLDLNEPLAFLPLWLQIPIGLFACTTIGVLWSRIERDYKRRKRVAGGKKLLLPQTNLGKTPCMGHRDGV